eukprot:2269843-Heterocapsa_arctica.AAC.1
MLALCDREDFSYFPGMLHHDSHSPDVQAVSGGCHFRSKNRASSLPVSLALCSPDLALEELRFLD